MKITWNWVVLLGIVAGAAFAEDEEKVEYKPMSIAALQEFGQLRSGQFGSYPPFTNEWVDHFGTFITQSVLIGETLTMNVGIGGLFQFQKREEISPAWGGSQTKYFFVGPTVADVTYKSQLGSGSWSLGAGMFSFKYNPDAANLGEYLFRAGAYPTFIMSGGYSFVNSSAVHGLEGLKANYSVGGFSADALLLTETTLAPLYDLSLATLLKYGTPEGLFSMFGGVNFRHLVPVRPSLTNKKSAENSYFRNPTNPGDPLWYTGHRDYYREQERFFERKRSASTTAADSAVYLAKKDSVKAIFDLVSKKNNEVIDPATNLVGWLDSSTGQAPGAQYFSLQSVLMTVGASLDFKQVMGSEIFGPQDLRLYFEAALLGLKDYPMFYTKKTQRLPVMVGFNFPGFKLLDLISLQYEWFDSPWLNSYETRASRQIAVPSFGPGADPQTSDKFFNDAATNDKHSWSVLVRKEFAKGLSVSAQAARDHIRSVSLQNYAGPGMDPNEMLNTSKDWYWMLQFSVGI